MYQQLKTFNNKWYNPGSKLLRCTWYIVSFFFFENNFFLFYKIKIIILRLYGAKVGENVIIKPNVKIKYPWFLSIGNNVWIGEKVWIDNLAQIEIGNDVCISQGVFLINGNHDWHKSTFDLVLKPILIKNESWIGAKSIVLSNSIIENGVVLCAGSVLSGKTKKGYIYSGSPAKQIKKR